VPVIAVAQQPPNATASVVEMTEMPPARRDGTALV
jgi:hypothetical protein